MFGSSFTCIAVAFSVSIFFFFFMSVWKEVGNGSMAILYSYVTFSLIHIGGHDWVTRICQPWELSPSRGWLLIAEVLGLCEVFVINI